MDRIETVAGCADRKPQNNAYWQLHDLSLGSTRYNDLKTSPDRGATQPFSTTLRHCFQLRLRICVVFGQRYIFMETVNL